MGLRTQKHPTLGSRLCHLQILNDSLTKGSAFYVAMGPVGEEAILAHKALFWPFPDSHTDDSSARSDAHIQV